MKYNPELRFREDQAIAQGQRIEEVIRSIHEYLSSLPAVEPAPTR